MNDSAIHEPPPQEGEGDKRAPRAPGRTLGQDLRLGLNITLVLFVLLAPVLVMVLGTGWTHAPQKRLTTTPAPSHILQANLADAGTSSLTSLDKILFFRHVDTRLPKYRPFFKQAGHRFGIPWTLLAAQGYQESHWNPRAVSPTGVRGIMMLTRLTSSTVGIRNRIDPLQSIRGGARHLARLLKYLPAEIQDPDRTWIALAAYNVGMGHVKDARILAKRSGKDPNRWTDLKEVLPLLAKKKYYRTLPHRFARGWEPVTYVERIRRYHILLQAQQHTPSQSPSPRL